MWLELTSPNPKINGTGAGGRPMSPTATSPLRRAPEFRVILPTQKGVREGTATRLVLHDEHISRKEVTGEEAAERLQLLNDLLVIPVSRKLRQMSKAESSVVVSAVGPSGLERPMDPWEREVHQKFVQHGDRQFQEASKQYSAFHSSWMPHDILRELHENWRRYYNKWQAKKHAEELGPDSHRYDNGAVKGGPLASLCSASSLLTSFFAGILIDDKLADDDAVTLSREIMEHCLEVVNDSEDDAFDACPYATFLLIIRNLSVLIFPNKHPFVAGHLLANVLFDRVHRIH